MRTLRISGLVVLAALMLPFAVILRSNATPADVAKCDNGSSWYEGIGKDRDKGLKLHDALRAVQNMVLAKKVPTEMYEWLIYVVADVYANPQLKPTEMAVKYKRECYAHFGITQI